MVNQWKKDFKNEKLMIYDFRMKSFLKNPEYHGSGSAILN